MPIDASSVGATSHVPPPPPLELPVGSRVDRYVIGEPLGAGGMGVVYRARDPRLQRDVALKLLRQRARTFDDAERSRLLSEARSLAQLSHRNVAQVFDAGEHHDQIFIALALIDGPTLKDWSTADHGFTETVDVLSEAGRGLAAAHAAGLVHRDFKPANVMIDAEGTAVVLDFGLATPTQGTDGAASDTPADGSSTHPGASAAIVMGTPAYMAPEQAMALPPDAKADQFSFFVTLYEALHACRPFPGRGIELVRAIKRGTLQTGPRSSSVPAWLDPILRRGLAFSPAERWPSMNDAVQRLRRRPRRWPAALAGFGGVGIAATALAWPTDATRCTDAADTLSEIWGPQSRAAVEVALLSTDLPYAAFTSARLSDKLTQYSEGWLATRTEVCALASTDVRRFDRAMVCLDLRRKAMAGLVETLSRGDVALVERATAMATSLASPQACLLDDRSDSISLPDDPQLRRGVAEAYALVDQARLADAAGRYRDALGLARTAAAASETLQFAPASTDALRQLGAALLRLDRSEDGRTKLRESYWLASQSGLHRRALEAAAVLAVEESQSQSNSDAALAWVRHGQGALAHIAADVDAQAVILRAEGAVELARGDPARALVALQQARELTEEHRGRSHVDTAAAMSSESIALAELGRTTEAIELAQRAAQIRRALLGDDHPRVADDEQTLAFACIRANRYDEALHHGTEALQIREATLGPDHPLVAAALNAVGGVHMNLGQLEEAAEAFERAAQIWGRDEDNPNPSLAQALHNLGDIRAKQGRLDEAVQHAGRALWLAERSLGPDNPTLTFPLLGLARAHLARGDAAVALPIALRARALVDAAPAVRPNAWSVYLTAARAYWGTGNAAVARTTATEALDLLESMPETDHEAKSKVEAWLADHPLSLLSG